MKAEELRIGNLVKDHLGRIQKVSEIREDSYICYLSNCSKLKYKLNTTQPIPLTEEWLLMFGFRKLNLHGYEVHFIYSHPKLHSGVTALYNADFSMKLDNVARGINYVHQLQNLYFALTGEELTIGK